MSNKKMKKNPSFCSGDRFPFFALSLTNTPILPVMLAFDEGHAAVTLKTSYSPLVCKHWCFPPQKSSKSSLWLEAVMYLRQNLQYCPENSKQHAPESPASFVTGLSGRARGLWFQKAPLSKAPLLFNSSRMATTWGEINSLTTQH